MQAPGFLPWQQEQARRWLGRRERFAHAWLIHGLPGIGKRAYALAAAASLLCEAPQLGLACGQCSACRWVAAGNHPDLRRIRPEAVALEEGQAAEAEEAEGSASRKTPSRDIRVDQLRSLHDWFNTATHRGGWRVAVLYPAEALNMVSANALLKVLEEPPEHTVFLLVSDTPDRLLPTLVSRCRRQPLAAPASDQATAWLAGQGVASPGEWLAAAGGAPLRALELSASGMPQACPDWLAGLLQAWARGVPTEVGNAADELEKQPPLQWIDILQRVFVDLTLAAVGAPVRYFPGQAQAIRQAAGRADMAQLTATARWLASQRAVAGHPLNAKLLTQAVLQRAAQACAG